MSLQSDVAAAFAEVAVTCPVLYAGQGTRGFLDRGQQTVTRGTTEYLIDGTVLRIATGALTEVVTDAPIVVGALGAANADGGESFTIVETLREDDGLTTAIVLAGGDA